MELARSSRGGGRTTRGEDLPRARERGQYGTRVRGASRSLTGAGGILVCSPLRGHTWGWSLRHGACQNLFLASPDRYALHWGPGDGKVLEHVDQGGLAMDPGSRGNAAQPDPSSFLSGGTAVNHKTQSPRLKGPFSSGPGLAPWRLCAVEAGA